jgi:hypothetical protein
MFGCDIQSTSRVIMSPAELKMCNPQYICKANLDMDAENIQVNFANVLWVAFSSVGLIITA